MKRIIIFLMMALLLVGSADAQKKTRKKTSGKARTTASTTSKTRAQQPTIYSYGAKWKDKAEAGDAEAQFQLGRCFYYGNGASQNYAQALKWLRKAAEQDHPVAVYFLGLAYENGREVAKNKTTADSYYIKAHKLASPLANSGNASAQYTMGLLREYGLGGVEKNLAAAAIWYLKAAEQGYAPAQNDIGYCYQYGQGVTQNYAEAIKWYLKAAEQGNSAAQSQIGYCYENGQGVTQNYAEAIKWYLKAAEQGNSAAQSNIGYCYENGHGVKKNYAEAIKWYRKAAKQGNSIAQGNLDRLQDRLRAPTKKKARPAAQQTSQRDKFYGQWTSAHGATFTIEYGPYLDLVGAGKFSGEWTSDGKLYVSFGYPDEITLRYYDGFLYDRNGRMYWRVGQ